MSEREGRLDGVLAGVRVLDSDATSRTLLRRAAGRSRRDVIRIERIGGGEDRWVAPVGDDGVGAMYLVMNRNKRAMTLDPACPEGREIVRKLVATADVVVANLPPEVLRSLALDLDSLRAVKPDIILTTVTAFGAGGPGATARLRRHRPGDGRRRVSHRHARATVAGLRRLGGLRHRVGLGVRDAGRPDGEEQDRARPEGRGRAAAHGGGLQQPHAVEQQVVAPNRIATVNRGQTSAPSDLFRTKDGWIIAYAIGGPMFARWARLMGEEHWLTDRASRTTWPAATTASSSPSACRTDGRATTAEALAALEKAKVPAGPLYSPQQALEDAHIRAAGLLADSEYPGLPRAVPLAPTPVDLSETPDASAPGAPARRAHRCRPDRAGLRRRRHCRAPGAQRDLTGDTN